MGDESSGFWDQAKDVAVIYLAPFVNINNNVPVGYYEVTIEETDIRGQYLYWSLIFFSETIPMTSFSRQDSIRNLGI